MRNAVLQLTANRSTAERSRVLRIAERQLERVDDYLSAVAAMDVGDREVDRVLARLRAEVDAVRRHLGELRRDG